MTSIMKKRFVSLVLVVATLCSMFAFNTSAFAMMENEFDLIEIAEWFSSDLKTRNANSIETEVTILKNEKDIQEVEFKEGDKVNIVRYSKASNEIFIDGEQAVCTEYNEFAGSRALGNATDHSYKDISYGQEIGKMTVAALVSVIIWALGVTNAVASFFANAIANKAVAYGYIYSKYTYCHMYKKIDSSYQWYMRYWDMYFTSDYSGNPLETYSQKVMAGN